MINLDYTNPDNRGKTTLSFASTVVKNGLITKTGDKIFVSGMNRPNIVNNILSAIGLHNVLNPQPTNPEHKP